MQYQSLHKFILNSITERDNVMECFCWRRTVNGEPSIFVFIQALAYFHFDVMLRISTNNQNYFCKRFEIFMSFSLCDTFLNIDWYYNLS